MPALSAQCQWAGNCLMNLYYCENTYNPILLTRKIFGLAVIYFWFWQFLIFGMCQVFLHTVNRTCNSFRGQIWADSLNPIIDAMVLGSKRYTMMLCGVQASPLALQTKQSVFSSDPYHVQSVKRRCSNIYR